MSESQNRQATMQSRRIELEREISIRVPAFDSFVTEYSANISTSGMFIKSEKPLPPDTKLSFEFSVAEDWQLIQGKATVVWTRYRDEGPERPAGMGVLFTELDSQSRRLIQWIIEKHVRDGGTPFDLGDLKETYEAAMQPPDEDDQDGATPAAVTKVVDQVESAPAPKKTPLAAPPAELEPLRFRIGPLLVAGIIVASIIGLLFWLSERGAQSAANPELESRARAEVPADEPALRPESADAPAVVADPEPAAPRPEDTPPAGGLSEPEEPAASRPRAPAAGPAAAPAPPVFAEVAQRLVTSWSRDWSAQDVNRYLSHYSRSFTPPDGQARSEWETTRRQRLRAPDFIQVSVTALETEALSESRGRALFYQSYRSNTFEDTVRKELILVREDGRWKILEESVRE